MSDVTIVGTSDAHAEGLHRCLDGVARERRYLAFVQAPPLEAVRAFVRSVVATNGVQVLAIDDNAVVGWCDILSRPVEGFTHAGSLGMGVAATHRRRGLGKQLASVALERSRAAGLTRVDLEVFATNAPAIALYEQLGFKTEGVKRAARRLDGVYDDIVLMALVWEPAPKR